MTTKAQTYFLIPVEYFIMAREEPAVLKGEGFSPSSFTQIMIRGGSGALMPTIDLTSEMYQALVKDQRPISS